ncbi:MAG: HNH endonuclease, partial [archaeon]
MVSGYIQPNQSGELMGKLIDNSLGDIKWEFNQPDIEVKYQKITKSRTVCKQCNGGICIDDGEECSRNNRCGSGLCCQPVRVCADNKTLVCPFCPEGKLNCHNQSCLKPSIKDAGDAYSCVWECTSGIGLEGVCKLQNGSYCSSSGQCMCDACTYGVCSKTIPQYVKARIFRNIMLAIAAVAIGLAVAWFFFWKFRNEKTQKRIAEKIEAKENVLEAIKKQINELKKEEAHKTKVIKNLSLEKERVEQEIKQQWNQIKPFPDPQANNRLVIINPYLGGYKCFFHKDVPLEKYNTNWLIHRWVWKKKHGRWPKLGYHIHHKDEDKYNNDIKNLEEIFGVAHYGLHGN